jgi:hypothetical protein
MINIKKKKKNKKENKKKAIGSYSLQIRNLIQKKIKKLLKDQKNIKEKN